MWLKPFKCDNIFVSQEPAASLLPSCTEVLSIAFAIALNLWFPDGKIQNRSPCIRVLWEARAQASVLLAVIEHYWHYSAP